MPSHDDEAKERQREEARAFFVQFMAGQASLVQVTAACAQQVKRQSELTAALILRLDQLTKVLAINTETMATLVDQMSSVEVEVEPPTKARRRG